MIVDKTCFFVHKYISLIQLDAMDNFCDEQGNMECNIREIKNRKCNRITMLRVSSCPSCVWMQASPLNFTNVAACTEELALSLFTPHTAHLSLWVLGDQMSPCCDFIILAVNTGMISVSRRVNCRTFQPKTPYFLMPHNFRQKSSCKQKVRYYMG